MIYYVSKDGSDKNLGTIYSPFLTIQKAADSVRAGDTVIVRQGEYRESVDVKTGGINDGLRVTFQAFEGEKVVIKGSEEVKGWQKESGNVYKAVIDNKIFNGFNPFEEVIFGDWFFYPETHKVHTGDVYLNGKSLYEAKSLDDVFNPQKRTHSEHFVWTPYPEKIADEDGTLYQWFAVVEDKNTILYVNLQGKNPNEELMEINVRKSCFFPKNTGVSFVTVRGFEMCHAATQFAPPTANQEGLIGPNWSKGWIIEDNDIHDSKCAGVSLGKESSTGDNCFTKGGQKPSYAYQLEAVFRGLQRGWSKENIGSHIIRNNKIHDCGQNGIVGHMGCAFSSVYGNEIYNIATKHEFCGHEIAGIKFHAAIDVNISKNYFHDCTLGIWLDWQAQGARVSKNIFNDNDRDFMIEVTHGPCLVDNNIFGARFNIVNAAQGTAFVNNLMAGYLINYPVINRPTPYHLPHSTSVLGTAVVYGSDDRLFNNIFVGIGDKKSEKDDGFYGTTSYNGATEDLETFKKKVRLINGDVEPYEQTKQPCYINDNAYLFGAKQYELESDFYLSESNPNVLIKDDGKAVYLEIEADEGLTEKRCKVVSTATLQSPRISEELYENTDGSPLVIDSDLVGEVRQNACGYGPIENLKQGKNLIKIWER